MIVAAKESKSPKPHGLGLFYFFNNSRLKIIHLKNFEVICIEATGIYYLQVAIYLQEQGYFVAVVNPLEMKRFRTFGLHGVKTDKADAMKIAEYGLACWGQLNAF